MIRVSALILALVLVIPGVSPAYAAPTVADIEKELICQCGCTMVVRSCECGTAVQFRAEIAERLVAGQSKDEILNYFSAEYGEIILATPAKRGFNLTVWLAPFLAIIVGGTALFFTLRKWAIKGKSSSEMICLETGALREASGSNEYREKFDEEFARFKEEEDS